MVFMGFGFFSTFLVRYGFSSSGFSLLVAAMAVQWAIVVQTLLHLPYLGRMRLTIERYYSVPNPEKDQTPKINTHWSIVKRYDVRFHIKQWSQPIIYECLLCQFGVCRDECSLITNCHGCCSWEDQPCSPSPHVFDGGCWVHPQSLATSNFTEGKKPTLGLTI